MPTAISRSSRQSPTNSSSCRFITPPAAAKPRSHARRLATTFAIRRRPRPSQYPRQRRNDLKAMVEPAQVRAARALIGWPQAKLAETAGVPVSKIEDFESGSPGQFAEETLDKIRAALETAGAVFLPKDDGGGIGVRLREALEGEYIGWNDLNASNDE